MYTHNFYLKNGSKTWLPIILGYAILAWRKAREPKHTQLLPWVLLQLEIYYFGAVPIHHLFTDDHEAWILTHMLYHGAYQHLWMWIQIQILLLEEQSKQCTGKYLSNNSLWIPLFFLNHIGMLQTPPQIHYNQSDQAGDTESTLAWTGRWGRRHNLQLFSPGTQVTEKHQEQV